MNLYNFVEILFRFFPKSLQLPCEYNIRMLLSGLEKEMKCLNSLIASSGRAIDIGANRGLYTYLLSKLCTSVESFEPQPWCSELITEYSKKFGKNINVYDCALSDSTDTLELNIPILRGRLRTTLATGLASFTKPDCEHKTISIDVRPLDDFNFRDVAFIKIDVEGHESEVIAGAKKTILREKPVMLVEIEQRHLGSKSIDVVFDEIKQLGYQGFFLYNGHFIGLDAFDVDTHQNLLKNPKSYVTNFIFKPNQ